MAAADGRPVFYGFQFPHHGAYSSFLGLRRALESHPVHCLTAALPRLPKWLPSRVKQAWLNQRMRRSERQLQPHFERGASVHYFYPENSLFAGGAWKNAGQLLLTCHQPAEKLRSMATQTQHAPFFAGLRAANRILVMSSSEVETYAAYAPQAEVLAVPHGVDTQFFRPAVGLRADRRFRVLTVGNWLRDYSLWNQVARRWLATTDDFEMAILASPYNERVALEGLPADDPRIIVLPRLSDEALLAQYQQADVLFLPLKDALANNALLEALACGLPIVATDLPAIREYGGDVARYIPSGDPEAAWACLQQMADNRDRRIDLQRRCRERAEAEYAWTVVARRHYDLYCQ